MSGRKGSVRTASSYGLCASCAGPILPGARIVAAQPGVPLAGWAHEWCADKAADDDEAQGDGPWID